MENRYAKVTDLREFVVAEGKSMYKSRMGGMTSPEQGEMVMLHSVVHNKSPLDVVMQIHFVHDNPSKKAEAMLADFLREGGTHKVVKRTPEEAIVELTMGCQTVAFGLTYEEAKKEPFVYQKDGRTLSSKWKTPRSVMQMLWARVISDGVRCLFPQAVTGVYTPEEINDFEENRDKPEIEPEPEPKEPSKVVKDNPQSDQTKADLAAMETEIAKATDEQVAEVTSLMEDHMNPEQREKALRKRGVANARSLSRDDAADIITRLRKAAAGK